MKDTFVVPFEDKDIPGSNRYQTMSELILAHVRKNRKLERNRRSSVDKKQVVFGRHPVLEALEAGKQFERIFVQKGMDREFTGELKQHQANYQEVPTEKLTRMTGGVHQGVVGLLSLVEYRKLEDIIPFVYEQGETPLFLVLDGITDVRNLGAIARSALGAGVHAMILPERNSAQINSDAMKASAGALHHVQVCREKTLVPTLRYLKKNGVKLVAAQSGELAIAPEKADLTVPTAIILGDEELGVSKDSLKEADEILGIPISGKLESYNVSVSAGILLYEVLRQRG